MTESILLFDIDYFPGHIYTAELLSDARETRLLE
jgi:hypothetical protein